MKDFLSAESIALKVCGVTRESDAKRLVELGVEALGVNFWDCSKRYCSPEQADFLPSLAGLIARVGVFVNAPKELPERLLKEGYLDYVQFHGDEDEAYCRYFAELGLPYLRAIGVANEDSVKGLNLPSCSGLLLDAHAPGVYGGTGDICDWSVIAKVHELYPELPILLAGGINVENVAEARQLEHIVALDVASGAESSPGVKDFDKVKGLMA